ncbi:MAG: hypothetical protein JWQ71_4094 [Pedosphaera sp.]|nr:hypothetical protein [Pedosphaera sp.]
MRRMKNFLRGGLFCAALIAAIPALATIVEFKQHSIDLTNSREAAARATWSDKLEITEKGLGFKGAGPETIDGRLQTKPFAIGLSWRPATAVTLHAEISPAPKPIKLDNGQVYTPYEGRVYARYSPDSKHWSSWQALKSDAPAGTNAAKRLFSGELNIPQRDREAYWKLVSEYSSRDVPWQSDEEAAVKWIVAQDPKFFENNLPFIGYVEFLFEAPFQGGQRISSFKANFNYALSGLHAIPKDKSVERGREGTPWRYQAP